MPTPFELPYSEFETVNGKPMIRVDGMLISFPLCVALVPCDRHRASWCIEWTQCLIAAQRAPFLDDQPRHHPRHLYYSHLADRPHRYRAKGANVRARKIFGESAPCITEIDVALVFYRDGNRCRHCGTSSYLCIDHIEPMSRGGQNVRSNLQVLCARCNSVKGNRDNVIPEKTSAYAT